MPRWTSRPVILLLLMLFSVAGFWSLGVISTDEPRYVSIGRAMAESGDWVTPRLNGEAWFEKPPLLYWLVAGGYRLGLGDNLAPRLGLSLVAGVFLCLWYLMIEAQCGRPTASLASLFLATSPFWIAYSYVAVTDVPLTITFTLAWLFAYRAADHASGKSVGWWLASGVGLGLAMLAKGLVPLVLFAPVVPLLLGRRAVTQYGKAGVLIGAGALATAGPWYVACYQANGRIFWDEFIVKHHFQRFATEALAHQRPVWFYLPYLLLAVLPWVSALHGVRSAFHSVVWSNPLQRMLLGTALFGLVFFSASINKLPGYILPLVPLLALFAAVTLERERKSGWAGTANWFWLAALVLAPAAYAVARGSGELARWESYPIVFKAFIAVALAAGAVAAYLRARSRGQAEVYMTALPLVLVVFTLVKILILPGLDHVVTVRAFWMARPGPEPVCYVAPISRGNLYGLEFYAHGAISPCPTKESPLLSTVYSRVLQGAEGSLSWTREDSNKPN